jgi:hypothetical protein
LKALDQLSRPPANRYTISPQRPNIKGGTQVSYTVCIHRIARITDRNLHSLDPVILAQNLPAAGQEQVHRDILDARDVPDEPRDGMLALSRDTPDSFLVDVLPDFILKGPRCRSGHPGRVDHGMLAQEQLKRLTVIT